MDSTEEMRRQQQADINAKKANREALEKVYGQVWDTEELQRDFTVNGFLAPYVVVHRKSDGALGSLLFQHEPRFYFEFERVTLSADDEGIGRC